MLYHKLGMPEEGEIVICTVTKVYPNSIFANLNEYGKGGLIHISEVAPGRIRNIRDYVREGRVVVCKVLGIHRERGHIDLSLRRVTEIAKREKVSNIKKEQKAEKIIEILAKNTKKDVKKVYEEVGKGIFEKYEYSFELFQDVAANKANLADFIPKEYEKELNDLIAKRIKIERIEIGGILTLSSFDSNGVEIIRTALKKAEENDSTIRYLGAGNYKVTVTADDFKTAEKMLECATGKAIEYVKEHEGIGNFVREKT